MHRSSAALPVALLLSAAPAVAQDVTPAIRQSALCAPVGTGVPSGAPRVAAAHGAQPRTLLTVGEQIAVSGAAAVGQRFFVRRAMTFQNAPPVRHTVGAVTVVEASSTGVVARIDMNCDGIALGDHLEPFSELELPAGAGRSDARGRLNAATSMTVSYGVDGRSAAGGRDFMLADEGANDGVAVGSRYAVFHTRRDATADRPSAEAIVVSVFPGASLLRIT